MDSFVSEKYNLVGPLVIILPLQKIIVYGNTISKKSLPKHRHELGILLDK